MIAVLVSVPRFLREVAQVGLKVDTPNAARWMVGLLRNARAIVQTKTLRPADEVLVGRVVTIQAAGTTLRCDGADFSGAREMWCRDVYRRPPQLAVTPDAVAVDLGANRWLFSVMAAKAGARVLAIDLQEGFEQELRRNLSLNEIDHHQVVWVTAHIGARSGLTDVKTLAASHLGRVLPAARRFGEVLDEHGITRVHFLKIDIEGGEYALFEESEEWLSRVEAIAMEVHCEGGEPRRIAEQLRANGFVVRFRDRAGHEHHVPTGEGIVHAWRTAIAPSRRDAASHA